MWDSRLMELGIHLPQVSVSAADPDPSRVGEVAEAAREFGFDAVSASDHFSFRRPWLDGPTLLATVAGHSSPLELATTCALVTLRGPVQLAAALAALSAVAPGRVVAGVGAGYSPLDYALTGIRLEDRWRLFDESVQVLRTLLDGAEPPAGWAHRLAEAEIRASAAPVPIWIASWGSPAGLRRVARLGDGWLASAHSTTPSELAAGRRRLGAELERRGRDPHALPTALVSMWTYIDDDAAVAERVLVEVLAPLVDRSPDQLRDRVCIGTPQHCVELLRAYAEAGCSRIYCWPVTDELTQLRRLAHDVAPLVR